MPGENAEGAHRVLEEPRQELEGRPWGRAWGGPEEERETGMSQRPYVVKPMQDISTLYIDRWRIHNNYKSEPRRLDVAMNRLPRRPDILESAKLKFYKFSIFWKI